MNLTAVLSHPLVAGAVVNQPLITQAPVTQPENHLGAGETVVFWILAPLMVLAALGLLFARKAVHAAMMLAAVMIGLAVIYAVQDAQFLFAAQIVVYTGAVMMLFLFVLMLVGVDSSDSRVETIKGQRFWAVIGFAGALLFGIGMVTGFMGGRFGVEKLEFLPPNGLAQVNEAAGGNPKGVARILFSDYFVTFELTGALLITAALGAMVLTHRERLVPRVTQKVLAQRRILANRHVAGLPAPGVFARHNSVDTPALLPDGTPSELSVNRVLRARGQEMPANASIDAVDAVSAEIEGAAPKGLDDVGDRMQRGLTGTQQPDDERVDGTNAPVEEPQEGRTR